MTVKKPIRCPGDKHESCHIITAVPVDGAVYLTPDAADFYPHGYRCVRHQRDASTVHPQPSDAPRRLTPELLERLSIRAAFEKAAA